MTAPLVNMMTRRYERLGALENLAALVRDFWFEDAADGAAVLNMSPEQCARLRTAFELLDGATDEPTGVQTCAGERRTPAAIPPGREQPDDGTRRGEVFSDSRRAQGGAAKTPVGFAYDYLVSTGRKFSDDDVLGLARVLTLYASTNALPRSAEAGR